MPADTTDLERKHGRRHDFNGIRGRAPRDKPSTTDSARLRRAKWKPTKHHHLYRQPGCNQVAGQTGRKLGSLHSKGDCATNTESPGQTADSNPDTGTRRG